jgi:hypothetical protein
VAPRFSKEGIDVNIDAATMQVPYMDALHQFKAYRELVKATPPRATRDDVALYKGLRALIRGRKVIDITLAIAGAGRHFDTGLPLLAIARADWPRVRCTGEWGSENTTVLRFSTRGSFGRRSRGEVEVSQAAFRDPLNPNVRLIAIGGLAQVPIIPPQYRPEGTLKAYHILFEAEWQKAPPVDPILLRHVDGPFFVVLAAWDLTPLEQAVLRAKL